jgi:hypothetical protein
VTKDFAKHFIGLRDGSLLRTNPDRGLISIRSDADLNRGVHAIQILYKCLIFFVSVWVNLPLEVQVS